jgi:hypothetical protein
MLGPGADETTWLVVFDQRRRRAMTGVGAECDERMLPLASVDDASEEIRILLRQGHIAKLEDWSLMNITLGQRGPFLSGTIGGKPDVCTTRLIVFQPTLGYAVTKNTIYILGKRRLDYWRNICLAMKKTLAGRSANRRMK